MKLSSNSSNTNGVKEARKILAIALKEASLVSDVYLSVVNFELAHGNNIKTILLYFLNIIYMFVIVLLFKFVCSICLSHNFVIIAKNSKR